MARISGRLQQCRQRTARHTGHAGAAERSEPQQQQPEPLYDRDNCQPEWWLGFYPGKLHACAAHEQVLRAVQPYPRLQPGRALNHDVPARARGAGDVTAMLNLQILRRCA